MPLPQASARPAASGGRKRGIDIGRRRHFTPSELANVLFLAGLTVETATGAGFPFFNLYRLAVIARLALDRDALPSEFFILYGDSYLPISMRRVERAWTASGFPALMTVIRNRGRWDASNVVYRDSRVIVYDKQRALPRQREMQWIDYGLSVFTRRLVEGTVESRAESDLSDRCMS